MLIDCTVLDDPTRCGVLSECAFSRALMFVAVISIGKEAKWTGGGDLPIFLAVKVT